ncbi:hypothetical protein EHV15_01715 [Paenibacillus oralis]|uniref:DUF2785 domain-containing protein n=1 Tax=Paenibacillus oralis TaxID=2490856 RepID=A0A3P3TZZ6_9BACL|nr:hypothetical protein [Paenibacillus oralis]RRJ61833.1 hypothetical protein EHV15_01715 [Paenibacillus oralis]
MSKEKLIEGKLQAFAAAGQEQRQERKEMLVEEMLASGEAQGAVLWIAERLAGAGQIDGSTGFITELRDSELTADLLEVAYESLRADSVNPEAYLIPAARLMHIEKKAADKTETELYVQYRAAALVDEMLSLGVALPEEALKLLLSQYYSDTQTEELKCRVWWRLAERGIDISGRINALLTNFHNYKTPELAGDSLLALWAALRKGFFDSPIPDSEKTCQVWLWHLVTDLVFKLKPKYDENTRLGSVGCLLEAASMYPQTQRLILECMENWGIKEPKRPRGDFQLDLKALYDRCRNHPGTTCLPDNYVITKKGIMMMARQ